MFRPNTFCMLESATGGLSLFAKPALGPARRVPCGIVSLNLKSAKSSVRADSSASHAAADQLEADAVLMFPSTVPVAIDDVATVAGTRFHVMAVEPRLAIGGRLDHFEVTCMIAAEGV